MAKVYKFKVALCELEEHIWREIEISSLASVAKLGYSILAAFGATASHLFCMNYDGRRYEIIFDDECDFDELIIDPTVVKLSSLELDIENTIHMEYDYGAGWEFEIKLISIEEMKKGSGTHYPYITDGIGNGIIEDTSPGILIDYIKETDKSGNMPKYYDYFLDQERVWDYRKFDIEFENMFFKDNIYQIQQAYENCEGY